MVDHLPATMQALELHSFDGRPESLRLVEKPIPQPRPGEVLVRISAAPINPSDLMFVRGLYHSPKTPPVTPGFEASGVIVAAGDPLSRRLLLGRRVACSSQGPEDGTWAQYLRTSAGSCIPLRRYLNQEQGASLIVNPITAWALINIAQTGHHPAIVQTAAASALGRMIIKLARRINLPVINIVRRPEQVELLRNLGAHHVLNSNDPDFAERLRDLCHLFRATLALDAVAGSLTDQVLQAMPNGSRAIVYGALSEAACQINPRHLIFEDKRIQGFWLSTWFSPRNLPAIIKAALHIQSLVATDLQTEIRTRLTLAEATHGLEQYACHMTAGKILLLPNPQLI